MSGMAVLPGHRPGNIGSDRRVVLGADRVAQLALPAGPSAESVLTRPARGIRSPTGDVPGCVELALDPRAHAHPRAEHPNHRRGHPRTVGPAELAQGRVDADNPTLARRTVQQTSPSQNHNLAHPAPAPSSRPVDEERARQAPVVRSAGRRTCGLVDQLGDGAGLGDGDGVGGVDLDGVGLGPLGHEPHGVGGDGEVLQGDHRP